MNKVTDLLSVIWSAVVLILGAVVLLGLVIVGVLLLLPILVFVSAFF